MYKIRILVRRNLGKLEIIEIMYKGYKFFSSTEDNSDIQELSCDSKIIAQVATLIDSADGCIDVTSLQQHAFKEDDYHIFLSHSHRDIIKAREFANILKDTFGLNVFIDGEIWLNKDEIHKFLDEKYSLQSNRTYGYESSNNIAAHVNLILYSSLLRMINNCECFIFFDTPNARTEIETVNGTSPITKSPWIYSEIEATRLIKTVQPSRKRYKIQQMFNESRVKTATAHQISFNYNLDLSHLTCLNEIMLSSWEKLYKANIKRHPELSFSVPSHPLHCPHLALDCLYHL